MAYDLNQIKVCGKIRTVAEEEFGGSFDDDETARAALDNLYADYVREGSPKDVSGWARQILSKMFVAVDHLPNWIMGSGRWPFLDGHPMVFIHDIPIPQTPFTEANLAPNSVLYLFGGRQRTESGGWKLCYRVVEQHAELRNVVAVPRRKG